MITPNSLRDGGVVEYRDAGRTGDELVREVVTGAGVHLNEGGRALMLGNWEIGQDRDWAGHPRAWAEESGLHAWVVQREELDPVQYIDMWMRDRGAPDDDTAGVRRAYSLWLDDFQQRNVSGIGLGVTPAPSQINVRGPC